MNKELTEKLEGVRAYLVSQNANRSACAVDEAIVALRAEPVAGQLSAEQIAGIKACLLDGTYTPAEIADFSALCDMALSSLRGTFADGIEAAAKVFLQHHAVTQDQADFANAILRSVRALAQGQRTSEQDAGELLREVLDWGLPDDLKQRIDAHLSRKEPT